MAYKVHVAEDFDSVWTEWERLLPACSANTIFLTPRWQRLWWSHFGDGADLCIASVQNDGETIGIAPLMLRDGVLSFLGDTDLFDYHDFIVSSGHETAFFRELCELVVGLDWHTFQLKSLRESSQVLRHVPALAESKGLAAEIEKEGVAPTLSLPSTWDEYLAGLTKKDRHELRRKLRRLESSDSPRQYACEDYSCLGDTLSEFFSLLQASSEEKREFLTPERERFFRDMCLELAPTGQCKLYFLEVRGVRVAACVCFDYADCFLLYNSGYDPEYSSLSVGLLNKALCIKEAIEQGRRTFDFLRGPERYKYDLGGKDQTIFQMTIRR